MQDRCGGTWSGNPQMSKWNCWTPQLQSRGGLGGQQRGVMGEETQHQASKRLLLWRCALGRVTFALAAWKRLPYWPAFHKKTPPKQIYGLSNECKKKKKNPDHGRTWRGLRQSTCSNAGGTRVLVCDWCHVPAVQRLNLCCRSLKPRQAQNIKVQTSHLVSTI